MASKPRAKKYAQIRSEMWIDDEWRGLTKDAQHLYMLLLTDPQRSYCGVVEWKPTRIVQRAAEWSVLELMRAAVELSYKFFLVFDQDTEEVLVRSFMRHDGLLAQPQLAVSVSNAFGVIGSNKIRAVVVHELQRLRKEDPDLLAWEKPQMKTVLRQKSADPREIEVDLDLPQGVGSGVAQGVVSEESKGSVRGPHTTAPTPTPATSPSSNEDALPNGESYPQGVKRSSRELGRGSIGDVPVAS